MTKPTLDDFLNNPNQAMRNGYYPDFMSVGAFMAKTISDVKGIYKRIFAIIFDQYYNGYALSVIGAMLINIVKFALTFTISLTFFPLFPVWWAIVWFLMRLDYKYMPKRIKQQKERLNELL